ncbi:hypothetical protein AAFF_G00046100 [Aldrovandia affinis]|uniref:Coiled-coil domain-containing protein 89 n=1 Tax=Aldrovandia affinis TaxID=143900 RepID=A0AAD7S1T0_9TELE|nr:hypothetical protein AAFF_G00046100 [Aldrovandia affinis]
MASPQRTPRDLKNMIRDTKQDMDDMHLALEKLRGLSQDEETETTTLRSRIDEQSSLICLERINAELENLRLEVQNELENERKRSYQLEQRFMDLAANHQQLVNFKDEYKAQNANLTEENERLREENESLFCKELQEKEAIILKLTQELKDLAEQHKILETEYQEKTTGFQIKLKELMSLHQTKEASLQDELHITQKQLKDAVDMYAELDMQLRQTREKDTSREGLMQEKLEALAKENDELLDFSLQREKEIQDKHKEINMIERSRQEAEDGRAAAEERFEKEAEEVNADLKVKSLQLALDESEQTCDKLKKDFEAYKRHSSDLLEKEKELNAKLRHMIG